MNGVLAPPHAFARLPGAPPIPASAGQVVRGSTAVATAGSTAPYTRSSSPGAGTTRGPPLHRAQGVRGQERARGHPLPQAVRRPPPLPAAREERRDGLTFIEASEVASHVTKPHCPRGRLHDRRSNPAICVAATFRWTRGKSPHMGIWAPRPRTRPSLAWTKAACGLRPVGSPGPRSTAGEAAWRSPVASERLCMQSHEPFIALARHCLWAVPS